MSSPNSDAYLADLHERYAAMPPVFRAKAPLFHSIVCTEGAMRAVGVNAEALTWIRRAQARLAEAKAILMAAEHQASEGTETAQIGT